jgi:hypothetical protein
MGQGRHLAPVRRQHLPGKLRTEECEGFKCQRGVKLQPPKRGKDGKQAVNEKESEYQFLSHDSLIASSIRVQGTRS